MNIAPSQCIKSGMMRTISVSRREVIQHSKSLFKLSETIGKNWTPHIIWAFTALS